MPARLARSEAFEADVQRQVDWLERQLDLEHLLRFAEELHQLETMLSEYPELGVRVEVSGVVLRKALFSRLPFVGWYRHDPARNQVQVLRLFHAHQERPLERPRRPKGSKR
jgi:plasmid stabilization system protein ParE